MAALLVNIWPGLPIKGWMDGMFARPAPVIAQASMMPTYNNGVFFPLVHWEMNYMLCLGP